MYDTFSEWRNDIRAAEKALGQLKAAQACKNLGFYSGSWRSEIRLAIRQLEQNIEQQKKFYDFEKNQGKEKAS